MVIRSKPNKIDMRIKVESVEQVDSFKYLGCNINSNMNCCQGVKQRKTMAKKLSIKNEAFFCGPFEKNYEKKTIEVLCVDCSVVWCRELDS